MRFLLRLLKKRFGIVISRHIPRKTNTTSYLKNNFYRAFLYQQLADIQGTIVECGVGHGYSLLSWITLSEYFGDQRGIWAFDSFEGFPEPTEEDTSPRNPQAGEWGDTSIESVKTFLRSSQVDEQRIQSIRFIKGFFSDTVAHYNGGPIALLHLDADLYQSYWDALTGLYEHVAPGGLVLFDEYIDQVKAFPGAKTAIDQFFGPRAQDIVHVPAVKKSYLVNDK